MILGDSILNPINPRGMIAGVQKHSKSGAKVRDIIEDITLYNIKSFSSVVLFIGGNDSSSGTDMELFEEQVAQRATIAHLSPMCQGQISFQKIQTHPSFNACSCYMKVSKGSNQKQQRKSGNTIFPIIRSIEVFLRRSRAANSVVGGPNLAEI